MPDANTEDDDDSGPVKYWLKYKVWGIPGYALVLAVFLLGVIAGKLIE